MVFFKDPWNAIGLGSISLVPPVEEPCVIGAKCWANGILSSRFRIRPKELKPGMRDVVTF